MGRLHHLPKGALEESPLFPVTSINSAAAIDVSRQPDELPFLGVFDRLRIWIGPSTSHTSGPITAAIRFKHALSPALVERIRAAPLAFLFRTDKSRAADDAVIPRLMSGMTPAQ